MMLVNIRCPIGAFGSLPYVAGIVKRILETKFGIKAVVTNEYISGFHNVLIDETVSSIMHRRRADIYWSDTPAMLFPSRYNLTEIDLYRKHYVTSRFNEVILKDAGIKVDGIIPRPVNPALFNYKVDYDNAKYDFISIGRKCMCDRKNLVMQRNLFNRLNFKYCLISDVYYYPSLLQRDTITKFNFGEVSDEKKIALLTQSRFMLWTSWGEGFGMPPVEAMAVGCVPVYTDAPAHNEYLVGIKIPTHGTYKSACYGTRVLKTIVEEEDVEEMIKYALGLSKEEWTELSIKCKQKALEIQNEFMSKAYLILGKEEGLISELISGL